MEKPNDAFQEQPNYYGTGRRPKSEKPRLSLILLLLALVLAVNAVTLLIHTAGVRTDGGTAEPKNTLSAAISAASSGGVITDGETLLGMQVGALDETQRRYWKLPEGVIVQDVASGGAAEAAGLQKGDVIVSLAGVSVTGAESYRAAVERCAAGKSEPVSVYRSGVYHELTIVLDE